MTTKVSSTNEFSNHNEKNYSNFGIYQLRDEITLRLPNNDITLCNLNDGKFSYSRNSQNKVIKKIVQTKSQILQIGLMPVLPIHVPAYKTDFFFLRFSEPLFIAENSILKTMISLPIEIGIFFVEQEKSTCFDNFSCNSMNSHFGLYGTPEDGKLCKYAMVSLDDIHDVLQPFIHAQFKMEIINELDSAASIGKIVFPATDHDLYFHNNVVMMDGLLATIKNRVGLHVIETVQNPITKPAGWSLAPRDTEKTDYKFSMERGFE